jgi:uncharacterized membrane protein
MSADLFVFVALSALLVFILWESWRSRRSAPTKRARSPAGFVPGGAAQEVAFFVLAAAFLIAGVLVLYSPELGASMRRSHFFRLAESWLGPLTSFALFVGAAIAVFVVGLSVRKRRLAASRRGHAG